MMMTFMRDTRISLLAVLALVVTLGLVAGAPGLALADPATQGTLEVVCNIGNTTPTDSVACRVSLDGAVQPQDILPGQSAAYALDAGSHLLQVDLAGDHAAFWGPASQQQTVAVATGRTTRSVQTFAKKGHLRANLSQPGIPGDFFVDGQLVAGQVTSIDLWVTPRVSHKIEVKNITDPATTDAYRWLDTSAYAWLLSGQEKTVTLKPRKAYVKGFLNLKCDVINIQPGDDVVCNVEFDGQSAGTLPAGGQAQYSLLPGQHTVTITLTGEKAEKWEATRSQNVRIRLGKTTDLDLKFDIRPYEYTVTLSGINANTSAIFRKGKRLGNKPDVFVKVGDCDSANYFFYGIDDGLYNLGDSNQLQEAINQFTGSFNHRGVAASDGFVAASVLNPIWADPSLCKPGETPLACEYRARKPSVALIMLRTYNYGDNWQEKYYQDMKTVVEYSLKQGVIPVLSTLPAIPGYLEMNDRIRLLASQYNVPLWDILVSVERLPNRGIDINGHLTLPPNGLETFFVGFNLDYGMVRRNIEGLEVLYRLKKEVIK
jgi:hypothetical protein